LRHPLLVKQMLDPRLTVLQAPSLRRPVGEASSEHRPLAVCESVVAASPGQERVL